MGLVENLDNFFGKIIPLLLVPISMRFIGMMISCAWPKSTSGAIPSMFMGQIMGMGQALTGTTAWVA